MKDGIVVTDGDEMMIVNQYSYCELVKWLIVEYVGVSYAQASVRVNEYIDYFASIQTISEVDFETHDWPYYYLAMTFYYGDYRKAKPIKPEPNTPEGLALYEKIEADILDKHDIKEPFIWIDAENAQSPIL